MDMIIRKMELGEAQEISTWTYEEPYSLYSMDCSQETLDELMNGTYYSVYDDAKLIGYFCYREAAQVPGGRISGLYDPEAFDFGLGLKPDLTGKGIGYEFVQKGIEFGSSIYKIGRARLTVAAFNKRAIRVYERAGFMEEASFINRRNAEEREFIIMAKPL